MIYPRFWWQETGPLQEPLGLLYLVSVLKSNGFEVELVDFTIEDGFKNLKEKLQGAVLAGISSSSALFGRAIWILRQIRQLKPSLPVVIGGPHPSADPISCLKAGFDFVQIGEGEKAIVQLARSLSKGRSPQGIDGLLSQSDKKPASFPKRNFINNLNELPFPARELVNWKAYFAKGLVQIGISAIRGCPYQCRFCKPMQDWMFGRKLRKRSAESVAEEIEQAIKITGKNFFLFRDDNLSSLGRKWFEEFRAELERRKLKIYFSAQARVNEIDEELIVLMKSCGLVGLAFGAESGSQKILDYYQKKITVEETIRAFDLCKKHNIGTHCFIILGAPVETKKDLELTIKLVERIKPDSVSISRLTPAPGTYLFEEAKKDGILNCSSWEDWDYYSNRAPIRLKHLEEKDLEEAERAIKKLVPKAKMYFRKRAIAE